ncbi:MAG TPA: VWA domain-containing protein, partial [Roseiflexaceae bacterium]
GISILNSALATLGYSQRFRDIWKDFAVANYAKNLSGPGVPAKYRYADMSQPGGNYGGVGLTLSQNLNLGDSVVQTGETVRPWSARYYELRPAANVPIVDIKVKQDSAVPVYYTILGIKGSDITYEYNTEARDLGRTLVNDGYDKVVVIVAGLENLANYRYSFNGTQPQLRILSPTTANKARVGNPTSPDKFRVTVEAIAADGTPLAGVNLASFSFRVGAQDVPAANILTSATVQGQQWFVLRAPAQTSAGLYDLRVRYSTILTATQSQAVDYSPRNDADSVLVIDRSGSMASNNKLTSAQAAARLYVDSWRAGDKVGVVDFNDVATVDLTLRNWTDTPSGGSRQAAFNQINSLTATGGTAIGDGLRKGWDQLNASGNAGHDWALVLLSDGLETAGAESLDTLIAALTSATGKRPVVHAIAVGPDADRPRMQKVANDTGGSYQYVSAPSGLATAGPAPASISDIQLNMDSRYRAIATKIIGHQQFFSLVGPTGSPGLGHDIVPIAIEGGAAELVLSLSWKASPTGGQVVGPINLIDPANNVVPKFESDTRHIVWRVPTPASGGWKLDIPSPVPGQIPLPAYLAQGSLRSDVTLDVYLTTPLAERTPGVPMGIVASLTDTGPIKSAIVVANVTTPLSTTYALPLYDDGAHGDGGANDGLYGNTFYRTGEAGSYDITVNATGISPL